VTPQQIKYFNLMRRFCEVAVLLPVDRENVHFSDPVAAAKIKLLLEELNRIQGEMDRVAEEAEHG